MADTTFKRIIGLMYRDKMEQEECMLFVFGTESKYGIWMHNMLFNIDIVWVDRHMRIVDLKKNLVPCKYILGCKTYKPKHKSKFVVEFNSGTADRCKIRVGNTLKLVKDTTTSNFY